MPAPQPPCYLAPRMSTPARPSPLLFTRALIACALALQLAGAAIGSFRADDWTNLERGRWALTPEGFAAIWTGLNPFTLYRPLVDLWHGAMLAVFGLNAAPMLAVMALLLLAQTVLLARLARERGGSALAGALAAAAMWTQANTFTWTTQWVSNVTGSLLALFSLLALVQHHRAVRAASSGRSALPAIAAMLASFVAGALCKEEIVLLPAALAALEMARWRRLDERQRSAATRSWLALSVTAAVYLWFRTQLLPTPQAGETRYHLQIGTHMFYSVGYFALHLGAMPAVVWAVTRAAWPAAHARSVWDSPQGRAAREEALGAALWAAAAILLYLPISGRPGFGYLYMPAFAVAYGAGRLLAHAAEHAAPGRAGPAGALAVHGAIATLLTAAGLVAGQRHTFAPLTREAWATLDREWPSPPAGARFVFLDPSGPETFVGRSVFNLVFDGATGSMLRLHYDRDDLQGSTLYGPLEKSLAALPEGTTAVYLTSRGRIERLVNVPPRRADDGAVPGGPR